MNRRKPIRHGTPGGYRAHFRHKVAMCEPCRATERRRRGYASKQKVAQCGTDSGYARHLRRAEPACPACRAAHAAAHASYRARRQATAA